MLDNIGWDRSVRDLGAGGRAETFKLAVKVAPEPYRTNIYSRCASLCHTIDISTRSSYFAVFLYLIVDSILSIMGAPCCAKPTGDHQSRPPSPQERDHGHDHNGREYSAHEHVSHENDAHDNGDHEHGGCCGDAHSDDDHGRVACCGETRFDVSSIMSEASTCCGSEERCNGEPIHSNLRLQQPMPSKASGSNALLQKNASKLLQLLNVERFVRMIQATRVSPT